METINETRASSLNTKRSKRGFETINGAKEYKGVDTYKDTNKGTERIGNNNKQNKRASELG